jgi:flagellar protein FliS
MERRLLHANAHNDPRALEEVAALLRPIKQAWDAIPPELHDSRGQAGAGARA